MKVKLLSRVRLFVTPWTVAHQVPLFLGFSWQEYWNGLPFPPTGDIPDPGIKPASPTLQADSSLAQPLESPRAHLRILQKISVLGPHSRIFGPKWALDRGALNSSGVGALMFNP